MSASKGLESEVELGAIAAPAATPAWQRALLVLLGLVVAIAPIFVLESFHLFQLTMAVIMALAVLGLNIVSGYNGQISLGHGAFFAVGAYITAILMSHWDWSFWATLPFSAAICAAVGFAIGFPALRLAGHYLALTTFSLAVAVPQILKHKSIEEWTGGVQGIVIVKPDAPAWTGLSQDQWLYFFCLAWVLLLFVLGWNLLRGRVGRAMVAIRDQPIAAQAMGVNTAMVKSLTFGVSALYTGIAGALGAIAVQFVAPDSFSFFLSITLLTGVVIGGLASISGAFFGALFIQFIPNIADEISKAAPWAIYGIVLIAFMYVMPTGVAGFVRIVRGRLARRRGAPALR